MRKESRLSWGSGPINLSMLDIARLPRFHRFER